MVKHSTAKLSTNVAQANLGTFAGRVTALAEHFGSVSELARKGGLSETAVRKWLGGSEPSRDRCIALAKGTGASLLWLVAGVAPMWEAEMSPHERDTQLIALGNPDDPEVRAATARRDQAIKDWSAGLAAGMASHQASQPLRREELMMAMQLASEALGNKVLSPADHAELVTLLYELLVEGLPQATVMRFARKAAGA